MQLHTCLLGIAYKGEDTTADSLSKAPGHRYLLQMLLHAQNQPHPIQCDVGFSSVQPAARIAAAAVLTGTSEKWVNIHRHLSTHCQGIRRFE